MKFGIAWVGSRPGKGAGACGPLGLVLLVSCSGLGLERAPVGMPVETPAEEPRPTREVIEAVQTARSGAGMVVSAHPLASNAGVSMLEAGGNAVDAAVATAFALAVLEPSMSGLGGRTQLVIRTAAGEIAGLDGGTEVPGGYRRPASGGRESGYGTIGIPGTVAALAAALEGWGTKTLAEALAPAITLADRGFPLGEHEARRMGAAARRLAEHPGTRRSFLRPDGKPYGGGEWFRQPELARTLRAVANGGAEAFYRGVIAERIAADLAANGGHVTAEDLAGYRAEPARVVRGSYRGHELVATYLPASGATTIQVLQMLDRFELAASAATADWAAVLAQAVALGLADRRADFGSPEEKAAHLTSPEWAEQRAREIRRLGARLTGAGVSVPDGDDSREPPYTTHLSVADGQGGVVALTQSLGDAFGSFVTTPGLGFLYAATIDYTLTLPGTERRRPATSQTPMIVLRDGKPVYVLGAAGGVRIISSVVAVLSRVLDHGLSLDEALAAPRLHPAGGDGIQLEEEPVGWPADLINELSAAGYRIESGRALGRVHGIGRDPATGELLGAADPRGGGAAAGPREMASP